MALEERNTYNKAFLQLTNLWAKDENIRQLVFSRRLARIAAELMGVEGVRLYHGPGFIQGARRRLYALACRSVLLAAGLRPLYHRLDPAAGYASGYGAVEVQREELPIAGGAGS